MQQENSTTPILVVNNSSLRPYIEAFHYEPENITQQALGTLLGYFEVKEYSEDSAYIVNFLNSVLKKEYYINTKRAVPESLDSALHKVNTALSELAKHGNVNWLGNLDAAVCVLEKNNLHFSVAGHGNILLSRGETFTSVSNGLVDEETQLHPLKTFVQVASGKLEINDRLIIASHKVFSILPMAQLKKNSQRLEGEKFEQFLKTAISNELDAAYVACVSISKPTPAKTLPKKIHEEKTSQHIKNAFSKQAFDEPKIKDSSIVATLDEKEKAKQENGNNYTDKKTGHIYVQGNESPINENESEWSARWGLAKESIGFWFFATREKIARKATLLKKDFSQMLRDSAESRRVKKEQRAEIQRIQQEEKLKEEDLLRQKQAEEAREAEIQKKEQEALQQKQQREEKQIVRDLKIKEAPAKENSAKIIQETAVEKPTDRKPDIRNFIHEKNLAQKGISLDRSGEIKSSAQLVKKVLSKKVSFLRDKTTNFAASFSKSSATPSLPQKPAPTEANKPESSKLRLAVPSMTRMRNTFSILSQRQKISMIIVLLIIIVVPYLAIKISSDNAAKKTTPEVVQQPTRADLLANETGISLQPTVQTVLASQNSTLVISAKQDSFAIAKDKLVSLSANSGKEFALPQEYGSPVSVSYMKDLDLVFLLTNSKKIISFSPATKQFKDNTISLDFSQQPPFIATYLTYLYIPDVKNDKIMRYPRAEGGFGEATSWLKDSASLASATDGTIDENIYVAQGDKVLKLFKGKKQEDFTLQSSQTPVSFDKIFTTLDSPYLYALDKKNARIVKYEKTNGNIAKQYFNESFTEGTSLSVAIDDTQAFIATPQGIVQLTLN